jgi:hypothetical protein
VNGKCVKCGEIKEVRHHHYKGYGTDETVLYCRSCDKKAHIKAQKTGRCNLTYEERHKISGTHSHRKTQKHIVFDETIEKNMLFEEHITYFPSDGHVGYVSFFHVNNGKILYEENI